MSVVLETIAMYNAGGKSLDEVSAHFGIQGHATLKKWLTKPPGGGPSQSAV